MVFVAALPGTCSGKASAAAFWASKAWLPLRVCVSSPCIYSYVELNVLSIHRINNQSAYLISEFIVPCYVVMQRQAFTRHSQPPPAACDDPPPHHPPREHFPGSSVMNPPIRSYL